MPWRAGLLVFLVHLGVQGFFLAQVRAAARAPAHAVGGPRGGDGPFELVWRREPRRWRWAALTLLGMTLACAPWTWRSYESLGGLFFVRCNFGLELRMGNHEGAGATLGLSARGGTERHPRTNEEEARKVQQLGELEYMRQDWEVDRGRPEPGPDRGLLPERLAKGPHGLERGRPVEERAEEVEVQVREEGAARGGLVLAAPEDVDVDPPCLPEPHLAHTEPGVDLQRSLEKGDARAGGLAAQADPGPTWFAELERLAPAGR